MFLDTVYQEIPYRPFELKHHYGDNFHILADPFLLTHLAKLCSKDTQQPAINELVKNLYQYLIKSVLNSEFSRVQTRVETRMIEHSNLGVWTGQIINPNTKTVTVNIMRAGTLPSQVCFDYLNKTLNPKLARQDHVIMARMTDEHDQVTGSYLGDSKIGGPIDDSIILLPDPMGATGSSISKVVDHYKTKVGGLAKKFIALNLIITPEYLRKLKTEHPDLIVYALRLDRGASPQQVLQKTPGELWNEESGLSDKQYILPGGGGFGEIMNNAYC